MPREVRDPHSGGIVFVPTNDERNAERLERLVINLIEALPEAVREQVEKSDGSFVRELRRKHGRV